MRELLERQQQVDMVKRLERQEQAELALTQGDYIFTTNATGEATITGFSKKYTDTLSITNILGGCLVTSIGAGRQNLIGVFTDCTNLTCVTIPNSVTVIENWSFSGCAGLTNVVIGSSVKYIGDFAFSGCAGLTSVTIPDGVTKIGVGTFLKCHGLTNVTIPASVTRINAQAFGGCRSLSLVTLPNRVADIGYSAFNGCTNLVSINIPANVTNIGKDAFMGCISLKAFSVDASNMSYTSVEGVLFNKGKTAIALYPEGKAGKYAIPASVTNIAKRAFVNCINLTAIDTDAASHSYSSDNGVLFNKDKTVLLRFPGGKGGSYTIPGSVNNIGVQAFYSCNNLTNVTLSRGITSIAESAFRDCERLACVTVPDSVTNIGDSAFSRCTGLKSIKIPDNIASIGFSAFEGCTNLPPYVLSIISSKTRLRPLQTVWTRFGAYLLQGDYTYSTNTTGQATITGFNQRFSGALSITNTLGGCPVTRIGQRAFESCWITSVSIPNGVTSIGPMAFSRSRLHSITIPNSVTNIGPRAFQSCPGLTSVTIPDSVTRIESGAFHYCSNLTNVIIPASCHLYGQNIFFGCTKMPSAFIGEVARYDTLSDNKDNVIITGFHMNYIGALSITNTLYGHPITGIGKEAFRNHANLTSVSLPCSVTNIEPHAFKNCTSLTRIDVDSNNPSYCGRNGILFSTDYSRLILCPAGICGNITIPESVKTIEEDALNDCTGLTNITVESNNPFLCSRDSVVFSKDLKSLVRCPVGITGKLTIPDGVTLIGHYAFTDCKGLTQIAIPRSVKHIGFDAFKNCTNLKDIIIPESVDTMGNGTCSGCTSLTNVIISSSVACIPPIAFRNCAGLTSFNIPSSVCSIGNSAFWGCSNLTSLTIPASVKVIENGAFHDCTSLTNVTLLGSDVYIETLAFTNCKNLPPSIRSRLASQTSHRPTRTIRRVVSSPHVSVATTNQTEQAAASRRFSPLDDPVYAERVRQRKNLEAQEKVHKTTEDITNTATQH